MSVQETPQQLEQYLAFAIEAAKAAGALLIEGFDKQNKVIHKSSSVDWMTEYDQASEKLVVERIIATYPQHGVVGEEGSRRQGQEGYTWYIDPLDGTTNYAHHFPMFAVSIALYQGERPLIGVVYDPLRDELFTAVTGQGAFLTRGGLHKQLHVTNAEVLETSLLATGFPYDSHTSKHNNVTEVGAFVRRAQGLRRAGSAALDMAYVAAGRLDGYWEFKLFAWDMAAARLIVEEAGGRFTKPDGSPIEMVEKLAACVSNGHIHQEMVAVLDEAARLRGPE